MPMGRRMRRPYLSGWVYYEIVNFWSIYTLRLNHDLWDGEDEEDYAPASSSPSRNHENPGSDHFRAGDAPLGRRSPSLWPATGPSQHLWGRRGAVPISGGKQ